MSKRKSKIPAGATAKSPEQVQATLALRRSGAAGGHDSRPRRGRTRQAAKHAALREW